MSLVVLAYPDVSKTDFEWLQSLRSKHDQLYFNVVEPHFTFVCPVNDVALDDLAAHVAAQISGRPSFPFALKNVAIVQDKVRGHWHVILFPDEGYSEIVDLHDRLYSGPLRPHRRLDIPFVPHVGVGTSRDPTVCKLFADDLHKTGFEIKGFLRTLHIALYEDDTVRTLHVIELG